MFKAGKRMQQLKDLISEQPESMNGRQLIEEAKRRYPKGTDFVSLAYVARIVTESCGKFEIVNHIDDSFSIASTRTGEYVYQSGSDEWAEVVSPTFKVTTYDHELDQGIDKFLDDVHADDSIITGRNIPIAGKVRVELTESDLSNVGEYNEKGDEIAPKRTFASGSVRDNDDNKPLVNHLDPYLRLRFGYLLRAGANKYSKGNWKLGQENETALECLHRHLAKFELNLNDRVEQDEDHLSAIVFNVMLMMKNEEKAGISVDHYYGTTK